MQDARDPTPLWRTVRELALKTLTETTKDLEVAAWLTEALVRSHGLAGLAAGAQVIGGPRRTVLGRPVPAARRRRHGDARLAGDRAQRSRRQRLADAAAVQAGAVQPAGRRARRLLSVSAVRTAQHARRGTAPAAHRCRRDAVRGLEREARAAGDGAVRGTAGRRQGRARRLAGDGQRDGREGRRRWPVHHGGARPAVRHHRYCQRATRRPMRSAAVGAAAGEAAVGEAATAVRRQARDPPAPRRRPDRSPRARTRCACWARSPTSSAAPNRTRRSPIRSTRRCAADA